MKRNKDFEEIGRSLTSGALIEIGKWFIIATLVVVTFRWADDRWQITDRDSSDGRSGKSGMIVRTDAFSGCQYLETKDGSITPRMGVDGKQICDGVKS